jgi:hypothetical protein
MYILAFVALAFSVCLVAFADRDDRQSLGVIASYSVFMGFQMLLTMYFLERQVLKRAGPTSGLKEARV